MLERIKQKLFKNSVEDSEVKLNEETVEAVVEAATNTTTTDVEAAVLDGNVVGAEELTAQVSALTVQLQEKTEALAAVMQTVADMETKLATFEQEKAQAEASAKELKMEARKAAVACLVGDAKAVDFVNATESLDDVAFEAVKGALAGSMEQEAAKPEFKEVGVEAKADTSKEVAESKEMKLLKQKFVIK